MKHAAMQFLNLLTFLLFWGNAAMKILVGNLKNKKDHFKLKSGSIINCVNHCKSIPLQTNINNENIPSNGHPNALNQEKDIIIMNPILTRTKSFFENEYFLEFSLKPHLKYYLKFFFQGIDMSYNLLNSCSGLNSIIL